MSASDSDAAITIAASVGWGRLRSQARRQHEHQHDRRRADDPRELRLGAGLLGDGGSRAARADREALEQPCRDVRGSDADHLAVAVDVLPRAVGERRRGRDRVGERDEHDPQSPGDEQR
jgi:hypothetical protein